MNIVVDISNVLLNGIFIFDKRKNIVIDGYFSRLVYSTPHFVMNGLYINVTLYKAPEIPPPPGFGGLIRHSNSYGYFSSLSLSDSSTDGFRVTETFDLKNPHNLSTIVSLCSMEEFILNQYKETKNIEKQCVYNIRNQLYSGAIKTIGYSSSTHLVKEDSIKLVFKISGVWETDTCIGVTFKFQSR